MNMNNAKHTPGPWKAVKDEARNPHYAWNIEGAPGVVPTIARLSMIDAGAQIEPNAHLIAAAPAMYEALQDIESYTELGLNSDEPKHWEASLQDILGIVRDALAQAEGRHHE